MKLSHSLSTAATALTLSFSATAQTTANGPYYATPSWDQTLPVASRFIVLSNMNNEAVLDRETGLVWQRTPLAGPREQYRPTAVKDCSIAIIGGRQGWRLPNVSELLSLADPANTSLTEDHLPLGHPFILETQKVYWAIDRVPANLTDGGTIVFFSSAAGGGATNDINDFFFGTRARAWCVRGGTSAAPAQ